MIQHLELVIHQLLQLVGGWLCALAMTVVVALAAFAFLCLHLYKFDRESCLRVLNMISRKLKGGWGWILMAGLLLLQVYALSELHQGLQQRLAQRNSALYLACEDRGGLPTTQPAPKVLIQEQKQFKRQMVFPSHLSNVDFFPLWTPEELRHEKRPAVNIQDELVRDDKSVVINRTTTVDRYVTTRLHGSEVKLKLDFERGGPLYQADFQAKYTFRNPQQQVRKMQFSMPLPENSGTLAGFRLRVNGQDVPNQDIQSGVQWEGEMAPQQECLVEVAYQHRGASSWKYELAGRREPIDNFRLQVEGNGSNIKFQRGSLYPSKVRAGKWEWNLQNQITSQSISLYFPYVPREQVIGNLFVFGPLSLIALTSLVIVWAHLRTTSLGAWRAALATLSVGGAYTLASYLVGYLPLNASLLIAFAIAGYFQFKALGPRLWLPVASSTLAPFTFLAPGHTGLLLSSLGLVILGLTIQETRRVS